MISPHEFGGPWTIRKLEVLSKYLSAYTTALKNQPFRKAYIDAFAGTGSRMARSFGGQRGLFGTDGGLQDGSARLALRCQPAFDRYIFIEQDAERCQQLNALKAEFPEQADAISVRQGEANQLIRELCEKQWRNRRAVLFLDPYGMQVDWSTVELVASTKAIDLWYLFPLSALTRMTPRSGDVPDAWRTRINRLLGADDWFEAFYTVQHEADLFSDHHKRLVKVPATTIGSYVMTRLRQVFPAVAEPGVLRNRTGRPLYLLCFAVGNPSTKAMTAALRIAEHTLKDLR